MEILIPVLALAGLGLIFGVGLAIFSKRFSVNVDPRLEKIHGLLPGTNCGACGGAGCFGFAEGLLSGKMQISACRVSEEATKEKIARLLGRAVDKRVKRTAVLHCNGGLKVKDRFIYQGINDCAAANLLLGGQKACAFGCLGFGSCVAVCPFGAITMSSAALPVVDAEKCKACNKCVLACPKKLFRLCPHTNREEASIVKPIGVGVYVACCSRDLGKDTKAVCPVGCIACGLCVKACRFDAIHVIDNLALIDYHKCTACGDCVKACPMGTIRTRS